MTYQVEHFYAAVATLAGDGHIKHRLIRAYQDNLDSIDDLELPITLKETFAELKSRMYTVTPLKGEGAIRASVRKMSAREASACAITILSLYSDMLQLSDGAQASLPLNGEEAQVVPPFLVKSVS
ncbi:MAG: hypothetical protein IID59_02350 [Proteobacteria bacterium]|nr:hypothetical protein [Pseudomonadota bacterium]